MIVRREKIRKELHRSSMEVFYKQNDMVLDDQEDWSGEKLDFLRHRSTRFTDFSENYVTERLWKEENGKTDTIFDSTIEDDEALMNTSQIEKLDENDFVRDSSQQLSQQHSCSSSPKLDRVNSHSSSTTTTTSTLQQQRNVIFSNFLRKNQNQFLKRWTFVNMKEKRHRHRQLRKDLNLILIKMTQLFLMKK